MPQLTSTRQPPASGRVYPFQPRVNRFGNADETGVARERYLYELEPSQKCLASHLAHHDVLTPEQVLQALETVARSQDRPACPVDSSLMAFLVSRWKGLKYSDIRGMRAQEPQVQNLAQLRILADIQEYYEVAPLPALCRWMADLCAPQFSLLHNGEVRTIFGMKISQAIEEGCLNTLVKLFHNMAVLREDREGYQAARTQYLLMCSELQELEKQSSNRGPNKGGAKSCAVQVLEQLVCCFKFACQLPARLRLDIRASTLRRKIENLRTVWGELN